MQLAREFREDFFNELPDFSRMSSTFNIGGEYRLKPAIPLRAGVELIRLDPNRQDASAPVKGTGLTLGLGYFWNALQWRIDASYEHYHFDSAPDDPADEIGYGDQGYLFIQRAF
jgi:long-subunit fatty acid transport protein